MDKASLDGHVCTFSHCQKTATLMVLMIVHTPFCSSCFKNSYERFYKTTTVKWEITDFDPKDEEAGSLYVEHLSFFIADTVRHSDSSDNIRQSVRTSWSDNRPANTKILRKKGGGKK